jgi:hypothetical protein
LPARPDKGTIVVHWPLQNTVVATSTLGENVTMADGTGTTYGVPFTVKEIEPVKPTVTGSNPRPCTLRTLLNQMKSPGKMRVPLKFEVIDDDQGRSARMHLGSRRCREARDPCQSLTL